MFSTDCFRLYNSSRLIPFHDILFHGLHIFSFLLPQNKYTCFQKHVCYLPLTTLSRSGKSRTVTGFYPTYVRLLPHLVGKKSGHHFSVFFTKRLSNRASSVLKVLGNTRILQENQISFLFAKCCRKFKGLYKLSAFYPTGL